MTPMMPSAGASLPPLGEMQSAPVGGQPGSTSSSPDMMAALVSGILPVKQGVDMILAGCKQIVQSGAIPGAEQPCSQIVALATALLPLAAQQMAMQGGGGPQGAPGGLGGPNGI